MNNEIIPSELERHAEPFISEYLEWQNNVDTLIRHRKYVKELEASIPKEHDNVKILCKLIGHLFGKVTKKKVVVGTDTRRSFDEYDSEGYASYYDETFDVLDWRESHTCRVCLQLVF